MTLLFTEAAEADIREVVRWYRDQDQGLEYEFLHSLGACLSQLDRGPEMYAPIHNEIRRGLLRRFPYAVFFVIEEPDIIVVGVFHGRRDPAVWIRRTRP